MTDLTPFFKKCISIYEDEYKSSHTLPLKKHEQASTTASKHSKLTHNNSFIQDSVKLNTLLCELDEFVDEVKTDYLLSDGSSNTMSEEDKDQIDSNFKIQLTLMDRKIETLKKYGEQLNKELEKGNLEDIGRNLITMGDYSAYIEIVNSSVEQIRSNIIKSLGLKLTKISNRFIQMNAKRMERRKQFNKSTLINKDAYLNSHFYKSTYTGINTQPQLQGEVSNNYKQLTTELPQRQVQELVQENQTLTLQLKEEQLQTVTQMETTMIDISSMISEIGLQLNLQNESINLLNSNQDEVMGNISKGNIQLVKANERAKDSGEILFYLIVGLSVILLILDWLF
ncbi:unnamed protein product [Ambrosiozyma monospora]|uniref:Unnamed protein product n=1 Tax=Ambrosiozyma monospora TaxID=43982 RepID=A0A9W6YX58_AMBMO|nr:unnamed protein product [Ambrosiozyma monospora]